MNELTFLDLVVLKKIDPESSVEKFGSAINTSFFETANLLGTIKIKGYISIESALGGISKVSITDAGTSILSVADQKAKEPIEPLDNAILHTVAGGTKEMEALRSTLNIRSGDLAFHINKLISQGFMDFEVRSAKVSFVLTEQGFNATGGVRVQQKLPAEPSPSSSPLLQPEEDEDTENEETEEIMRGSAEPAKPAQRPQENGKTSAPPWVDKVLVKAMKAEKKEDVKHLLSGENAGPAKKAEAKAGADGNAQRAKQEREERERRREEKKKPRELTPEEQRQEERRRRMYSKMEHYLVEYAPYLLLLLIVLAIFTGAVYLAGTKLA